MSQNYIYPPGFSSVTIPAVGSNGSPIPSSSILIAGENTSGDLQPVSVDNSGNINVNIQGVSPNPLPTTDAADGPVTPGAVASKSILTGGQYNSSLPTLSDTEQCATQLDSSGRLILSPLTNASVVKAQVQDNAGNAISSTGGALNVSATQSGNWNSRTQDGSGNPISSTGGALNVSAAQSGNWNSRTQDGAGNAISSTGGSLDVNLKTSSITVTVSGTVTADQGTPNATPWNENIAQFGGNAVVTGTGSSGAGIPRVTLSNDSSLAANQSVNLNQVGASNLTLGQKNSASSIPVVIASDQSAIPSSSGRSQANTPIRNVYSSVNITTGAYVQLVASLSSTTNYLDIFDSSGQAMILATGGSGSEVDQAYIPPGGDQIPLRIPSGTRVSYKALSANATSGYLLMNFYT